ncbi:MAG: 16S rRNA (uracil(1498)-N(3))-methyltransferase [Phycisphaerales bacterium]|nr:16S rRNA (uracil(1498)-N(3))-methyltransferase [Phycisphaerales bacterium]
MSRHRLTLETTPPAAGTAFSLTGDEAWHAVAVKRVQKGDTVELLDGRGTVATATVTASDKRKRDALLDLRIESVRQEPPTSPRVELWSAVPKADRAAHMIDQLAQAGAALWRPLVASRSVTDADHKAERLQRIATEASKQCGRAWHLAIDPPVSVADAAAWSASHKPPAGAMLVADADGLPPSALPRADHLVVLVGPEGGFTDAELITLRAAGAASVRLGPHVLRTETAAVAAGVAMLCR